MTLRLAITLAIALTIGGVTQAGWDDVPLGNIETRPPPLNWKPPPAWNGYFGDDSYGNYHPNGPARPGWVHPSTRKLRLEVSSNSPGSGGAGHTQLEIGGETKTIPQWMAIELLKRELDALQPSDASQPDQPAKALEGLHPFALPVAVASQAATQQAGYRFGRDYIFPAKPVKTIMVRNTRWRPIYLDQTFRR